MGDKVVQSEGGADEPPQSARPIYNQQYRETNLNFGPQMRFPPIEQVKELEANCPGFTERMVALIQREAAHRQSLESRLLDERHTIAMRDLEQENGRIKTGQLQNAVLQLQRSW
jgi:uncharacterized membrane protein